MSTGRELSVTRIVEVDPILEAIVLRLEEKLPKCRKCKRLACILQGRHLSHDLLDRDFTLVNRLVRKFGGPKEDLIGESSAKALEQALHDMGHVEVVVHYYGVHHEIIRGPNNKKTEAKRHLFSFSNTSGCS